jgi:hypothetical protein
MDFYCKIFFPLKVFFRNALNIVQKVVNSIVKKLPQYLTKRLLVRTCNVFRMSRVLVILKLIS